VYWAKVLNAVSTVVSTSIDTYPFIDLVPNHVVFGQYQIPVKPIAIVGIWLYLGTAKLLDMDDNTPPDDIPSLISYYSDDIANLLGEGIDNWIVSNRIKNVNNAIVDYISFLNSDYIFLMNNPNSAYYFANDLYNQMSISLGGNIDFFSAFIPEYINEYRKEMDYVVKINRNWKESSSSLNNYITNNELNITDDIIKEMIELILLFNKL
jgi:hypothetical protein